MRTSIDLHQIDLGEKLFLNSEELMKKTGLCLSSLSYHSHTKEIFSVRVGRHMAYLNPKYSLAYLVEHIPALLDKEDVQKLFSVPELAYITMQRMGFFFVKEEGDYFIDKDTLLDYMFDEKTAPVNFKTPVLSHG